MGLRGPGAVAIKRPDTAADPASTEAPPWEKPGLTRAGRVVKFIESLPITAGPDAGKRMKLRKWQLQMIREIYATDAKRRRPVRTAVVSLPRKCGKTTLAAGLALCHLAGPEAEQRGEVYSAANDRFQASRIYNEMAAIIKRTPDLLARISQRRHSKEMEVMFGSGDGSIYAALSADAGTKDGLSPSFVIYDEFGSAPNRALYDVLDTAMGGRAEPLLMIISTQAPDDLHPLSDLIDYGLRVQAGEQDDPAFHLTLFTAPPDADPFDPATWRAAIPALADFRSLGDVERQALQAQRMPAKLPAFRNKILNQRCAAEVGLLSPEEWVACNAEADPDGDGEVFGGLDIGGTRDLTALVRVIRRRDGTLDALPIFWLPSDDVIGREDRDRVPYRQWRDRGLLHLTPGKTLDPSYVAQEVARLHRERPFKVFAYDRWGIDRFRAALAEVGVTDLPLEPHGQGFRDMTVAIDALERAVADRKLRHGGHPILTWNIANCRVIFDPAQNRKIEKARSSGRVDGAVALAMALNVATKAAEPVKPPRVPQLFV